MPLCTVQETQHHPASVDLELVKRLLASTKAPTLRAFLAREFCNVSDDLARAPLPGLHMRMPLRHRLLSLCRRILFASVPAHT
jgi:DNA topoisomerase VI subunit B